MGEMRGVLRRCRSWSSVSFYSVLCVMSGLWQDPVERFFLWIGHFRGAENIAAGSPHCIQSFSNVAIPTSGVGLPLTVWKRALSEPTDSASSALVGSWPLASSCIRQQFRTGTELPVEQQCRSCFARPAMQCQGGVSIFLYRHPWPRGREQFVSIEQFELEPEERSRKDKQPSFR
jgi:hypothetical protein